MQNWTVRHHLLYGTQNRDALVLTFCQRFFSESEFRNSDRSSLCLPDEGDAEQQEKALDDAGEDDEESESDSDSEDSGTITEIRFVPSDKAACECVE